MVHVKNFFKSYGNILLILIFTCLLILVGINHEHWSDEAQSFLLARDNSFLEIFHYIKYEATPPLWIFIIKLFILFKGSYNTFFLLPIIISLIGIILFIYKTNSPWYFKILYPFTYFIFYQYGIVARSYCLILPILVLLYCVNKEKRPFLYSLLYLYL